MLLRCQPGFESWLIEELSLPAAVSTETGGGWVRFDAAQTDFAGPNLARLDTLCFPHVTLLDEVEITGESVNSLAEKIAQHFFATAREERFETTWPFLTETAAGLDGLGRRADGVHKAVAEILKKRMSRVARLASDERPRGIGSWRGLYLFFADFKRVFVARDCFFSGQRRMADDPMAPSRSYLKLEEAYGILNTEPVEGETVVDLGAAPGGWSYSAAKRGARVIAVDNGPLKGGALNHPLIDHRREDAFAFRPQAGEHYNWLLCDLVEDPHHVMQNVVEPWLQHGWCDKFVVILKLGRANAVRLVADLRREDSVLSRYATDVCIRHLFHDREELTIVGRTKAAP